MYNTRICSSQVDSGDDGGDDDESIGGWQKRKLAGLTYPSPQALVDSRNMGIKLSRLN